MTRKLTILSVVATIALVSNGLNAQEKSDQYEFFKSSPKLQLDAEWCQNCPAATSQPKRQKLKDGVMIGGRNYALEIAFASNNDQPTTVATQTACPSNCNQCEQSESGCQSCPHCTHARTAALPTNLIGELTGSTDLPGSTSFMREQCADLTQNRQQLAEQIAKYLASENHRPDQVQRVLELAMESAADQAHRQAMNMNPMSHHQNVFARATAKQNSSRPMPLPPSNALRPKPLSNREADLMKQVKSLKSEQQSTRNVITLLKQDLQRIAEDVSQLRVESNIVTRSQQTTFNGQRQQTWPSRVETPRPTEMVHVRNQFTNTRPVSGLDTVNNLKRRIRVLENQLAMTTQQSSQIQRTGLETPTGQLLPRANVRTPLVPAASQQPYPVVYYVGDVMAPPFVSSTLQLMQYLKNNVEPESWKTFAEISITEPSISLEITQTPENHRQIRSILEYIRDGKLTYLRRNAQR